MAALAAGAYLALAAFVLAGFALELYWEPSWKMAAAVAAAAAVLASPAVLAYRWRRLGTKEVLFRVVPAAVVLVLAYSGAALVYGARQLHPFEPYLQNWPAQYDTAAFAGPGGYRVLALGGSTTANAALPPDQRYPALLEAALRDAWPERRVAVLNAGTDWWTTKHSLIHYASALRRLEPDLVIVMHAINDLYRSCAPPRFALGQYRPSWAHYYGPAIQGARPPTLSETLRDKYLASLSANWYSRLRLREREYPLARFRSLAERTDHLRALIRYARADGADVLLLTQPSLYKPDLSEQERAVLRFGRSFCSERAGLFRTEYPSPESLRRALAAANEDTRRIAAEEGVALVDLAAGVPPSLEYFYDDVHYTAEGARLVGQLVAGAVLRGFGPDQDGEDSSR